MKDIRIIVIALITTVLSGCSTNIAQLPITSRDQETYNNKYAEDYLRNTEKKSLRIAIAPQNPELEGKDKRSLTTLKSLTNAFGDGLEATFSNLSDFKIVPRSEVAAILADKRFVNLTSDKEVNYKIRNVNYMVVYRISSYNFDKFKVQKHDHGYEYRYSAYVKVKISLIDLTRNVKEFTKTITGNSKQSAKTESISLLNSAIEEAIRDFSTQFAIEYAPPAIVQQTKGNGRVALLNIGKDCGLIKNMKIEFFVFKEKNDRRCAIPFAYGKVIELGKDFSWVEVDDYEDAGVKENNFARVRRDQSKSFLEKLTE